MKRYRNFYGEKKWWRDVMTSGGLAGTIAFVCGRHIAAAHARFTAQLCSHGCQPHRRTLVII